MDIFRTKKITASLQKAFINPCWSCELLLWWMDALFGAPFLWIFKLWDLFKGVFIFPICKWAHLLSSEIH